MRNAKTWVKLSKMQSRGKEKVSDKGLQALDSLLEDHGTFESIRASRLPFGKFKVVYQSRFLAGLWLLIL